MDEQKAWIKSRRKRRLRITAVILCMCLLFTTYPDILETITGFAAELRGEDELMSVSGFVGLPEEISGQTVPVGTPVEELTLPDTLEAYVTVETEDNTEDDNKPDDGNQNKEDNEDPDNSDQNKGDKENPDEGNDGGENGEEENPDAGNGNDDSSDGDENSGGDNGNGEDGVENEDGEIPGDTEGTEDENSGTGEAETADFIVQTGIFVIPEYRSENVITVETLENKPTTVKEESVTINGITWQSVPEYDGNAEGTYVFTAVLPEGYALAEGVSLPQITVTVQGNNEDAAVQALLDRITALPDVQEYMEKEPDIDNWEGDDDAYEEAYEEWMEGLSAYEVEALAIWEEYEALTQEQQAQIPEELLTKLTAWVELAEQAAGSRNVMAAAAHTHNNITFTTGWGSTTSLPGSGNYYLTANVELSTYCQITGTLNLCLNGHEINGSVSGGMIRVNGGTLNVYDCSSSKSGKIYCSGINNPIQVSENGVLNLYGGTVKAEQRSAIPIGTGSGDSSGGTVNVYSGATVSGGTNGIYVNAKLSSSHVNIYGGSIISGSGGKPVNMQNPNGSVMISGDAEMSPQPSIYTVTPVVANAQVSNIYTINYANVTEGDKVVSGSTDTVHYKLNSSSYVLVPYEGNLIAAKSEYMVVLNPNGGSGGTGLTRYTTGQGAELPTDWTKTNYVFEGWYENANLSGTKVESISNTEFGNKTYYAKWTPVSYTITYDLDGGTVTGNPTSYTIESSVITLKNPTKTGYGFAGWSGTGITGNSTSVTITAGSTGNRSYTAHWTANTYTITYNGLDGATLSTKPTQHTYGTATTVGNPTKTGYTFAGWKVNGSNTATTNLTLGATAYTADITLTATWTANTYTVTFNYQNATGGNSETNRTVTYDSTYGTVSGTSKSLPSPTRTGYTFKGWYTQTNGSGSKITDTTAVKITTAQTLYAYWKDETAPDAPILQTGVTLPTGWTNTQDTIPLKLYDGVAVTELWVSVDGGAYTKVSGFTGGSTQSTQYSYTVTEGEHSYQFKTRDAAGNESEESTAYKVMLDSTKPVIGTTLIYENKAKEFLNWIIGKKDLIIKVPVTDEGSGVEQISYTMTPIDAAGSPDNGSAVTKTAPVINGKAQITFSEDFKGTIAITCTDAVGNTADSVIIGVSGGGVIVEDTAPDIAVLADRGTSDTSSTQENGVELSEGYYETVPAIIVTVQDDIEDAVAAGVGTITYHVEDGAEKNVPVAADALQEQIIFTIPDSEIPTGVTVIQITATDNAGNEASKNITVKVKGPEKTPAAAINYYTEKLKALVPNAEYSINGTSYTADEEGCIPIDESWFDTPLSIVKKGNDIETLDSSAQSLVIPARPDAPDAPIGKRR